VDIYTGDDSFFLKKLDLGMADAASLIIADGECRINSANGSTVSRSSMPSGTASLSVIPAGNEDLRLQLADPVQSTAHKTFVLSAYPLAKLAPDGVFTLSTKLFDYSPAQRAFVLDGTAYRSLTLYTKPNASAVSRESWSNYDGLDLVVRSTAPASSLYRFTLHNSASSPLAGIQVYPNAILVPEDFGWDSTYMRVSSSILDAGTLSPGETKDHEMTGLGPAHLYQPRESEQMLSRCASLLGDDGSRALTEIRIRYLI
jgi:hypothetical protein